MTDAPSGSAPAASAEPILRPTEYEALVAALSANGRGRAFLAEHARRARSADLDALAEALARIEARVSTPPAPAERPNETPAETRLALERIEGALAAQAGLLAGAQERDGALARIEAALADPCLPAAVPGLIEGLVATLVRIEQALADHAHVDTAATQDLGTVLERMEGALDRSSSASIAVVTDLAAALGRVEATLTALATAPDRDVGDLIRAQTERIDRLVETWERATSERTTARATPDADVATEEPPTPPQAVGEDEPADAAADVDAPITAGDVEVEAPAEPAIDAADGEPRETETPVPAAAVAEVQEFAPPPAPPPTAAPPAPAEDEPPRWTFDARFTPRDPDDIGPIPMIEIDFAPSRPISTVRANAVPQADPSPTREAPTSEAPATLPAWLVGSADAAGEAVVSREPTEASGSRDSEAVDKPHALDADWRAPPEGDAPEATASATATTPVPAPAPPVDPLAPLARLSETEKIALFS